MSKIRAYTELILWMVDCANSLKRPTFIMEIDEKQTIIIAIRYFSIFFKNH